MVTSGVDGHGTSPVLDGVTLASMQLVLRPGHQLRYRIMKPARSGEAIVKPTSASRMFRTPGDGIYQQIGAEHQDAFAAICGQARDNLSIVIDMILIHNEQKVRGNVPRASLNKPVVIFSAAAWERLVTDLRYLTAEKKTFKGAGTEDGEGAYLTRGEGSISTRAILGGASGGRLPKDWLIRLPTSGSGKTLHFAAAQKGARADLAESVDFWVKARNHVVHRNVPTSLTWAYESDADGHSGQTFNTTLARIAMTTFLQLIDQTIRVIADAGKLASGEELWLPEHWLDGQLQSGERGVKDEDQLRLWYGRSLRCTGLGTW
ncbi:MAG: hypothetical protein ACLPKE_03075 [Streptosporangiaceae bacterium]